MYYFTVSGNIYKPTKGVTVREGLPTGTYQVGLSMEGFFLDRIDDVKANVPKFYGDLATRRDRIMTSFADRKVNTGVILSGNKGSGKSLLARAVCETGLADYDLPVLIVSSPFTGEGFNSLLNSIGRPFILLLDEFEKVYHNPNDQNAMLSVFDGTYENKILFMVTCNESNKLVTYFHNRPGRFFYAWKYGKLEPEFIREYATENLKNLDHAETLVAMSYLYYDFNFDILKAFVEDMNRYGESAKEVAMHLNAEPDTSSNVQWEVVDYRIYNPTMFKNTGFDPAWAPPGADLSDEVDAAEVENKLYELEMYDAPAVQDRSSLAKAPIKKGFWKPFQVAFQGSPFAVSQATWYDKDGRHQVSISFGPQHLKGFKYGEGLLRNKDVEIVFRRKYSASTWDYSKVLESL